MWSKYSCNIKFPYLKNSDKLENKAESIITKYVKNKKVMKRLQFALKTVVYTSNIANFGWVGFWEFFSLINPEFNINDSQTNKIIFEIITSLLNLTSISMTNIYRYDKMLKTKNKKSTFIRDIVKLEFTGNIAEFEEKCDELFNVETYEYTSADFINLFCIFHEMIYNVAKSLGINESKHVITELFFGWLSPYKWAKKGTKYSFTNFINQASETMSVNLTSYDALHELENWAKIQPRNTPENINRINLINTNVQYSNFKTVANYDAAIDQLANNKKEFIIISDITKLQKLIIYGDHQYKLDTNYMKKINDKSNAVDIFKRISEIDKAYSADKKNKEFITNQYNKGHDLKRAAYMKNKFAQLQNINAVYELTSDISDSELTQLIIFMHTGIEFTTSNNTIQRIFAYMKNNPYNAAGNRALYNLYSAFGGLPGVFPGIYTDDVQSPIGNNPLNNEYRLIYAIFRYNSTLSTINRLTRELLDTPNDMNLQFQIRNLKTIATKITSDYRAELQIINTMYNDNIHRSTGFIKRIQTMTGYLNRQIVVNKINEIQTVIEYYMKVHDFSTSLKANIDTYVNRQTGLTHAAQLTAYQDQFDAYYEKTHMKFLKNAEISTFIFGLRYFWVIFKYTISTVIPNQIIKRIFTADGLGDLIDELIGMIGGSLIGSSYLEKIAKGTENPISDLADETFDDKVDPILDDIINNIITQTPQQFKKKVNEPYTVFDDTEDQTIKKEIMKLGGGEQKDIEPMIYLSDNYKKNIVKSVISTSKKQINKKAEKKLKNDSLLRGSITGMIAANTIPSTFSDKLKDKIFLVLCKLSLKAKDLAKFTSTTMNLLLSLLYLSSRLSGIVLEHYKLHRKDFKKNDIKYICDYVSAHNRIIFK